MPELRLKIVIDEHTYRAWLKTGDVGIELPHVRQIDAEDRMQSMYSCGAGTVGIKFLGGEISLPRQQVEIIYSRETKIKEAEAEIDSLVAKLNSLKERVGQIGKYNG